MNKQPYTIEEILLILEAARMDDVADRLRELWKEQQLELERLGECLKTTIAQRDNYHDQVWGHPV